MKNAKFALQHNIGLGGACVVSIYKKYTARPAVNSLTSDPAVLENWEREKRKQDIRPFAFDKSVVGQSKL